MSIYVGIYCRECIKDRFSSDHRFRFDRFVVINLSNYYYYLFIFFTYTDNNFVVLLLYIPNSREFEHKNVNSKGNE